MFTMFDSTYKHYVKIKILKCARAYLLSSFIYEGYVIVNKVFCYRKFKILLENNITKT